MFGQTTNLTNLLAAYGVSRDQHLQQGAVYGQATPWLDLYGQFLYSQPDTNVHYQQTDAGNLLLQSQLLFYTSQQYVCLRRGQAAPHQGSFGAEIRPLQRVRIVESWLTDRLHDAGPRAHPSRRSRRSGVSLQMARCWLRRW